MRIGLRIAVRVWAPICAAVSAGCCLPTVTFSDVGLPVRRWETGRALKLATRTYVANREGSALIELDPRNLDWREHGRVSRLETFDVDAEGLHWARKDDRGWTLFGPSGVPRTVPCTCGGRLEWTACHAVLIETEGAVRWVPKAGGPVRIVAGDDALRFLAVDYLREIVWAIAPQGLVALGPDDPEWRPAALTLPRSADLQEPSGTLTFGRTRFAFLEGGLVYSGTAGTNGLHVDQILDLPDDILSVAFDSRDEDIVLARGRHILWAWNLPLREGRRLMHKAECPPILKVHLHFDWREGHLLRIWPYHVDRVEADGKIVAAPWIILDRTARVLNEVWDALVFPADLAWGGVCLLTPVGLVAEAAGIAKCQWPSPVVIRGWRW